MVFRTEEGVWMEREWESVSRVIAIEAMTALGLDPHDFRVRDKVIMAISTTVDRCMDEAAACPFVHARCGACGIAISEDGHCGCPDIAHPVGRVQRDQVSRLRALCEQHGIDTTKLYGE